MLVFEPDAISRYQAWLLARRTREGRQLAANTLTGYFVVLVDLHRVREQLSDVIREHPFHGMELQELLGSLTPTSEIPHIPMDLAVLFMLVAVRALRGSGSSILRQSPVSGYPSS